MECSAYSVRVMLEDALRRTPVQELKLIGIEQKKVSPTH